MLFSIEKEQLECKTLHTALEDDADELRDLESDLGPMQFSKISNVVADLTVSFSHGSSGAGAFSGTRTLLGSRSTKGISDGGNDG